MERKELGQRSRERCLIQCLPLCCLPDLLLTSLLRRSPAFLELAVSLNVIVRPGVAGGECFFWSLMPSTSYVNEKAQQPYLCDLLEEPSSSWHVLYRLESDRAAVNAEG